MQVEDIKDREGKSNIELDAKEDGVEGCVPFISAS